MDNAKKQIIRWRKKESRQIEIMNKKTDRAKKQID